MKLFHKLLVAPATIGLLAPFSAVANEINVNQISEYGISQKEFNEIDFNSNSFSKEVAQTKYQLTNDQLSKTISKLVVFQQQHQLALVLILFLVLLMVLLPNL